MAGGDDRDRPAQGVAHRDGDRRGRRSAGQGPGEGRPGPAGAAVGVGPGWPERTWAVENATGLGHLITQQLLAAGEAVLDVPPKLAAKARLLSDGDTNKNDPNDARSVAVAGLRSTKVRPAHREDYSAVMGMWSDRYLELAAARTQVVCRLHALLCELVPGGYPGVLRPTGAQVLEEYPTRRPRRSRPSGVGLAAAGRPETYRRAAPGDQEAHEPRWPASGTTVTEVVRGRAVRGLPRSTAHVGDISRFASRAALRRLQRHRPGRSLLRGEEDLPAVTARQPPTQPRHPHGRHHPDPLPHIPAGPTTNANEPKARPARKPSGRSSGGSATLSTPAWSPTPRRRHLEAGPGGQPGNDSKSSATGSHPAKPALRKSHSRTPPNTTTRPPARPHPTPKKSPPSLLTQRGTRSARLLGRRLMRKVETRSNVHSVSMASLDDKGRGQHRLLRRRRQCSEP